jgi:hypothetical protein
MLCSFVRGMVGFFECWCDLGVVVHFVFQVLVGLSAQLVCLTLPNEEMQRALRVCLCRLRSALSCVESPCCAVLCYAVLGCAEHVEPMNAQAQNAELVSGVGEEGL